MKEKLSELGIKTTELSSYMRISRPSLYKYIGLYEQGEFKDIPNNVLNTFRYVDRHKKLTKEQVMTFVILEFSEKQSSTKKETIRNYLLSKGNNDPKVALMYQLITTESLNDIIPYLTKASSILKEGEIEDDELYQVARLINFKHDIITNEPLSEEELNKAKEVIGEST